METIHSKNTEKQLRGSAGISDLLIGAGDGLTIPFALTAGMAGAAQSVSTIATSGLVVLVAGSIVMGLGGFLAGKTEIGQYQSELAKDFQDQQAKTAEDLDDHKKFLANLGLNEEMQARAAEEMIKDRKQWIEFMMKYELGLNHPDPSRAIKSAFNIAGSYALAGLVPVAPYFIMSDRSEALLFSICISLVSLVIFGCLKSRFNGTSWWKGSVRAALTGALAAAGAYFVASLF